MCWSDTILHFRGVIALGRSSLQSFPNKWQAGAALLLGSHCHEGGGGRRPQLERRTLGWRSKATTSPLRGVGLAGATTMAAVTSELRGTRSTTAKVLLGGGISCVRDHRGWGGVRLPVRLTHFGGSVGGARQSLTSRQQRPNNHEWDWRE